MSTKPQSVIVVFQDSVSKEQVRKYADDFDANNGIVKNRYYESDHGINGFSATITEEYLDSFKSFQGDKISYIESDQTVTTQN